MNTSNTWIIEQNYTNHSSDYDIQIGAGRAVRFQNFHSFSSVSNHPSTGLNYHPDKPVQSVVKVTGHKKSSGGLKAHVDYITRRGQVEIETEQGDIFKGNDRDDGFKEWVVDHEQRMRESMVNSDKWKTGRIATSIVFSTPEGTNPEALKKAVREFAQKHFGNHRYIFAVHSPDMKHSGKDEPPHPHVHMVVENISPESEKSLQTEPENLRQWRRQFGEIAKEYGINVHDINKSRSKPAPHEKDMNIYQMLKRGEIPDKYQSLYQRAKDRVKNNNLKLSVNEAKLIEKAKSDYIDRQHQIDDLTVLMKSASKEKDRLDYQRELVYLKSVNSSIRMPMNNSQMMMKYAYEQSEREQGKGSQYFYSAPSVRHFMFADKLAKSHGVNLPPMAHASYKDLNNFISEYADKPTPKFMSLIKSVAIDRGLNVDKNVFHSHKAAMKWFKENKDIPTVKAFNYARSLADKFNVETPTDLTGDSYKNFISEYRDKISPQMRSYAQSVANKSGVELREDILKNKSNLAKWIDENKDKQKSRSQALGSMINRAKVNDLPDIAAKQVNQQNLSPNSLKTIREMIQKGFNVSQDDVSDDIAVVNLKRSFEPKSEKDVWVESLNKIEAAKPVNERQRDGKSIGPDR